jgi:hypothetical protein
MYSGVGELAPWRVGPPEHAAVGAERPARGARSCARSWARHSWAAWAGAERGVRWTRAGPPRRAVAGWAGLGAGPRSRGPRKGEGGAGPSGGGGEREKGAGWAG